MSETKFTPGPWTIKSWDVGDEDVIVVPCEVWADRVCVISAEGGLAPAGSDWTIEKIEANAALIAAAPELYAALDAMLHCSGDEVWAEATAAGEAALAKARGESS